MIEIIIIMMMMMMMYIMTKIVDLKCNYCY